MRTIISLCLAIFFAMSLSGTGSAALFTVDALTATKTSPLDTGIVINPGDVLTISVDPLEIWSLGPPPGRDCNADGTTYYPPYSYGGLTTNYGTMVGQIDAGPFFVVGTSFGSQIMTQTGNLKLMCWDSFYDDNTGSINANVTVPLPSTMIFLGSGLLGLLGWRRSRKS